MELVDWKCFTKDYKLKMDQDKAIRELSESFEDFKKTQLNVDADFKVKLDKILRGLYGDQDNDQAGLIARQSRDEEQFKILDRRVERLEKFQYKVGVFGIGGMMVIQILWNIFKDKLL